MATDILVTGLESPAGAIDPDTIRSRPGEPTWEVARLFPPQGDWTEAGYLALDTKQLVEFVRGRLEFLPMPTKLHQRLARFLFKHLDEIVERLGLGEAFFAPLRVRTVDDAIREPDVTFFPPDDGSDPRAPATGLQLAIEVVSPGKENRERDYDEKREEYALARVPEYWIVDDEQRLVTVLVLDGETYRVHGEFEPGATATSVIVPEFAIDVTALFAAAGGPTE